MAVTITWNGDITGLTEFIFAGEFFKYYKVTDRFFTQDELINYTAKTYQPINNKTDILNSEVGGNIYSDTIVEGVYVNFIGGTENINQAVIISISDTITEDGTTIEKGTYFGCNREKWPDSYTYVSELILPNANEITAKPLAEITYNGETIAQLNAGETATLSCEGMKMASDVVVKVNEVESKIPEGYVKPEGTLELVFNNIEAEFPIDCSQYAKVTVNTAEPLKITDPTVLDNITDSPWGVGGNVFLYEGATTDSYENGVLYYLEDTEK